jgi:hypothetical protein
MSDKVIGTIAVADPSGNYGTVVCCPRGRSATDVNKTNKYYYSTTRTSEQKTNRYELTTNEKEDTFSTK